MKTLNKHNIYQKKSLSLNKSNIPLFRFTVLGKKLATLGQRANVIRAKTICKFLLENPWARLAEYMNTLGRKCPL